MLRPVLLGSALALLVALAGPAAAQRAAPRSIDDCERIDEPMAYNACLARFGPERGGGGGAVRGRGRGRDVVASPRRGGAQVGRRANGRKFLIIEPAPRRRR